MLAPKMQWLYGSTEQEERGGQDLSCSGFTHLAGSNGSLSSWGPALPSPHTQGFGEHWVRAGPDAPSQEQAPSQLGPSSAPSPGHPLGFGCPGRAQRALTIAEAPQDPLPELGFSPEAIPSPEPLGKVTFWGRSGASGAPQTSPGVTPGA